MAGGGGAHNKSPRQGSGLFAGFFLMVGRESQLFLTSALQDCIPAPNSRVSHIDSFANSDMLNSFTPMVADMRPFFY